MHFRGFSEHYFIFEHNCTPSGRKTVTGVQVITASQVQSIGCRSQALFVLPITEHKADPLEAHTSGDEQGHKH